MSVDVSISRLPVTNPELFGRDAELAWLDACWKEGVHVASIVAWGGVGKSALVNAWLARVRDEEWRGARRVYGWSFYSQGTDRLSSSDEFIDAALRRFGDADPTQGSPWDKGERLARLVRRERTLLVLDGVEPLQWGPGVQEGRFKDPALGVLIKELAGWNEGLCLITTRLGLTELEGLRGKKVQARDLEHLSAEAGAQLLEARGARGLPEELRAAATEYGGHCFSLTLLGSYIRTAHKGDVRKRDQIPPLEGKPARRMMAIYERWFKRKPELDILRMLGLFDRPASEDEIAVLRAKPPIVGLTDRLKGLSATGWNEAITTLRDVGLLAKRAEEIGEDRLDAHPLVREYFGERLKRELPAVCQEGHRRLYEHLKENAKDVPETLEEMAPLYEAAIHGCQAGKSQEALNEVLWRRIRRGHEKFSIQMLGAFGSEVAVLSAFFNPPWERLAPGLNAEQQHLVLNAAGYALRALGRLEEAERLMRWSLKTGVSRRGWENAAIDAFNLSDLLQTRGKLTEALVQAQRSVELAQKSGNESRCLINRTTLAAVLHAMGSGKEAAAQFDEAERAQRAIEPERHYLYSFRSYRYCDLLLDLNQDADVQKRATISLLWHTADQLQMLAIALDHLSLGRVHVRALQRGHDDVITQAAFHLKEAIDGLRRAGTQHHLPLGLLARADLHIHTRAFPEARRDLDEAHTLATRCGFRLHETDAHLGYARLAIAEGNPTAAREHLAKARVIVEQTGYHRRDEELAQIQSELTKLPPPREPAPVSPSIPATLTITPTSPPSMPTDHTTTQKPVDLGIVVALQEEFRELLDMTGGKYTPHEDEVLTSYRFEHGPYRVVAAFVGDMGESQATRVTERIITLHQPASILVIGIAAGVHDDLRVGDVYVPPQAVQYMQDAKASPRKGKPAEFALVPGAPAYRADHGLLDAVRNLEFKHRDLYRRFRAACAADLAELLPDISARERLFAENLVRHELTLLADGHVATGPVVGAAAAFSGWIRTHDRNVKALEMESAAVLLAAQTRGTPKRALAIRGISDYGDDRKKTLDEIGGGALRKYAMRNAVRLLWALLDAGALPRNGL